MPCEYSDLAKCASQADLVFESVVEDAQIKKAILTRLSSCVPAHTIICTGTSGLPVALLMKALTTEQRRRFLGLHLFNPPYNMPLCELIPTVDTDPAVTEEISRYAVSTLRRVVVRVKDYPGFLANRIGFYVINDALQQAEKYKDNGGVDYIDSILGQYTGRNMAPIATADFVGLDVHKAIVDNLYENTSDFVNDSFEIPPYVQSLINQNHLGKKTKSGLYQNEILPDGKSQRWVYDTGKKSYRQEVSYHFPYKEEMIAKIRCGDYMGAFETLKSNESFEASLCLEFLLKYISYSLYCAHEVGMCLTAADDAMAVGFNWIPPLSLVEALGGKATVMKLMQTRLPACFTEAWPMEEALMQAPASNYDFRKYIKGKG